ncbi:unnamed protein product [Arctogadus glacialis]
MAACSSSCTTAESPASPASPCPRAQPAQQAPVPGPSQPSQPLSQGLASPASPCPRAQPAQQAPVPGPSEPMSQGPASPASPCPRAQPAQQAPVPGPSEPMSQGPASPASPCPRAQRAHVPGPSEPMSQGPASPACPGAPGPSGPLLCCHIKEAPPTTVFQSAQHFKKTYQPPPRPQHPPWVRLEQGERRNIQSFPWRYLALSALSSRSTPRDPRGSWSPRSGGYPGPLSHAWSKPGSDRIRIILTALVDITEMSSSVEPDTSHLCSTECPFSFVAAVDALFAAGYKGFALMYHGPGGRHWLPVNTGPSDPETWGSRRTARP